jgi:hypothetical protein
VNLPVESVQLAGRAVPRRVMLGIYGFPGLARAARGLPNAALPDGLHEVKASGGLPFPRGRPVAHAGAAVIARSTKGMRMDLYGVQVC